MYGGSDDTSKQLRKEQAARDKAVLDAQGKVNAAFDTFTPEFYESRKQAYVDYALPQLAEQYQEARKNLVYSLAGKGLIRSGSAGSMSASLERELHKNQQGIADAANQDANSLRSQVEDQRSRLLAQAYSAMDPSSTVVGALNTASSFQTPSTYAPLANMFRDWTTVYTANKVAQAYPDQQKSLLFGLGGSKQKTVPR